MRKSDGARVHAARLTAQLLSGPPAPTAEHVVRRLLAVQAQDPRGARLAVRARSSGVTAGDVDAELDDRRLVVSWLNRGTLHLVTPDDYRLLHPLTTPQLATASTRRLRQEGVDQRQAALGVDTVVRALAVEGPLTRPQLRERLDAVGVPTRGQALVHVLLAATLSGLLVRGPVRGREQAYVLVDDWLGPPPPVPAREEALTLLARRYLAGHGPASAADLARWAGLPLGDARRGLAALEPGEVVTLAGDDGQPLLDLADRPAPAPLPPPRLLGAFEPLLLGWTDRSRVLGAHARLVTVNGIFRPLGLVAGRAVATWGLSAGRVEAELLDSVRRSHVAALAADALDVLRFLGLPASPSAVRVTGAKVATGLP